MTETPPTDGARDSLDRAVDLLYERVLADEFLREYFWDVDLERLKAQQRTHLAAALGTAPPFSGRALETAHNGLKISDFAFDCFLELLVAALADAGFEPVEVARARQLYASVKGRIVEDFKPDPKYAAFAGAGRT